MKEHPIIFKGEMVRAILDGRKTQTRRIVKPMPLPECDSCVDIDYGRFVFGTLSRDGLTKTVHESVKCPYGRSGDRLYVRETFQIENNSLVPDIYSKPDNPLGPVRYHKAEDDCNWFECPRYRASEPDTLLIVAEDDEENCMRWQRSIHMPKWCSRIHLEITDVRVERVQDIKTDDILNEGVRIPQHMGMPLLDLLCNMTDYLPKDKKIGDLTGDEILLAYWCNLWDSINGKKKVCDWQSNPWVWVVEFKRIEK